MQASGTSAGGGGGGSSAGNAQLVARANSVNDTIAVKVGKGGAGGAAISTPSTNGIAGTAGGVSSCNYGQDHNLYSWGGTAGNGGTTVVGVSGTPSSYGMTPGVTSQLSGPARSTSGGPGGSISTVPAASAGGTNGRNMSLFMNQQYCGGPIGQPGTAGYVAGDFALGGGGGGSSITGNGGNGASAVNGAGGGGGASLNGFSSGAGGNGGDGIVIITTYF